MIFSLLQGYAVTEIETCFAINRNYNWGIKANYSRVQRNLYADFWELPRSTAILKINFPRSQREKANLIRSQLVKFSEKIEKKSAQKLNWPWLANYIHNRTDDF